MRLLQEGSRTAVRRRFVGKASARKAIASLLALAAATTALAACSAPPLDELAMQPEANHHMLALNTEVTVTFTNRSGRDVTVEEWVWDARRQEIFELIETDCIRRSPIRANGTCIAKIRKRANGNVNVYWYMGNFRMRALGGVIIR